MHIPDNYLSPQTCAVLTCAMIPAWTVSVKKIREEVPAEKVSLLGVAAAFSFLGMMFNIPVPGGTTGHAVGGTLAALLFGPYAACAAVSIALLLQALLFGDGGILSFGANCFNMALVLPFVGYGAARLAEKAVKGERGRWLGAAAGAYLGINAAALAAAIEFGIQPMLFRDAAGQALYCPYGLNIAVPAMMAGHLTLFGLAEVVYTTGVYGFLRKTAPDFALAPGGGAGKVSRLPGLEEGPGRSRAREDRAERPEQAEQTERGEAGARGRSVRSAWATALLMGALIVLTPLGLLAEGTAWGEWGAGEIAATGAGYTPAGIKSGFSFQALIPDYSVEGMPAAFGYILSAVIGAAVLVIAFKLLSLAGSGREGKV